jgi:hypothetical protein
VRGPVFGKRSLWTLTVANAYRVAKRVVWSVMASSATRRTRAGDPFVRSEGRIAVKSRSLPASVWVSGTLA